MHWTYALCDPASDLQQGDILLPTQEILSIFEIVHPHFRDPKYRGFMVLTQTCDLVTERRFEPCKSPYVNVAVIRAMDDQLPWLLSRVCKPVEAGDRRIDNVYRQEDKGRARQLLERIVNQNEQALGLFYLHPDVEVRIAERSVVMLQISVALRAKEHYAALRAARCGRLAPQFQGKLGWLMGNLFSRVATEDWPEKEREGIIDQLLNPIEPPEGHPVWMKGLPAGRLPSLPAGATNKEQVVQALELLRQSRPLDAALDRTVAAIRAVVKDISEGELAAIEAQLRNDPQFTRAVKAP